jgi:hypothetical protein
MKDLKQKIAGMKAIDQNFDAGNDVSLTTAEAMDAEAEAALEDYNSALATVDDKYNFLVAKDRQIRAFNGKVLPAAKLKYGSDSSEYEQLGGVRDSERKKPVRKPKPPTS